MSHWEEYHTNSLVLGYIFNPTELQITCIVLLFIYAVYPDIIYLGIFGYAVRQYVIYFLFIFAMIADASYIYGTLTHIAKQKNYMIK